MSVKKACNIVRLCKDQHISVSLLRAKAIRNIGFLSVLLLTGEITYSTFITMKLLPDTRSNNNLLSISKAFYGGILKHVVMLQNLWNRIPQCFDLLSVIFKRWDLCGRCEQSACVFTRVDQHTGGKWLIHGTKRRKDNEFHNLGPHCRLS